MYIVTGTEFGKRFRTYTCRSCRDYLSENAFEFKDEFVAIRLPNTLE